MLTGILSDGDVGKHLSPRRGKLRPGLRQSAAELGQSAKEFMTKNVTSDCPYASIREAARILAERRIGCPPVIDKTNTLLGVIGPVDLMRFLEAMLGGPRDSTRSGRTHHLTNGFGCG